LAASFRTWRERRAERKRKERHGQAEAKHRGAETPGDLRRGHYDQIDKTGP
jgi:hypothetical protein